MPLHMIKLVVGVDTLDELKAWRRARQKTERDWVVQTRMTPKRAAEIEDGGSLYRVIKGVAVCRQRVLSIDTVGEGRASRCRITVDTECVPVAPRRWRPFQGWRYLEPKDAPPDLDALGEAAEAAPPELVAQLRELGAW
ncbi:MAG: DUF1489 domain-containing protein [Caulobacteraceae bacterium]|nr:DUF1489 domain-containing protein [Caulobacter sp.]